MLIVACCTNEREAETCFRRVVNTEMASTGVSGISVFKILAASVIHRPLSHFRNYNATATESTATYYNSTTTHCSLVTLAPLTRVWRC